MDSQFRRILNLVRRTGDRVVAFDSNEPENAYVVMPFDDYEDIMINPEEFVNDDDPDVEKDLTEDRMIDKINRDIAIWKSDEQVEEKIENIEKNIEISPKKSKRSMWKIPEERLDSAEEVIEDQDRQYLEEIGY